MAVNTSADNCVYGPGHLTEGAFAYLIGLDYFFFNFKLCSFSLCILIRKGYGEYKLHALKNFCFPEW